MSPLQTPTACALQGQNPPAQRSFRTAWQELSYLLGKTHFWLYVREDHYRAQRFVERLRRTCQRDEIRCATTAVIRAWALALVQEGQGNWGVALRRRSRLTKLVSKLYRESLTMDSALASYATGGYGPEFLEDHFLRQARACCRAGQKPKVILAPDREVAVLQEYHHRALIAVGLELHAAFDYANALPFFRRARRETPDCVVARYNLANTLHVINRYQEAFRILDSLMKTANWVLIAGCPSRENPQEYKLDASFLLFRVLLALTQDWDRAYPYALKHLGMRKPGLRSTWTVSAVRKEIQKLRRRYLQASG